MDSAGAPATSHHSGPALGSPGTAPGVGGPSALRLVGCRDRLSVGLDRVVGSLREAWRNWWHDADARHRYFLGKDNAPLVDARTLKSESAAYPAAVELFLHS